MAAKTPIRAVKDGSGNITGFSEYQSGEFLSVAQGGTGAVTVTIGNIASGDEAEDLQSNSVGQPKAFQIYNGDTSVIDVAVITAGGDDILIKDLAIGTLSPLAVTRVKSTGTTASKIIYAYS